MARKKTTKPRSLPGGGMTIIDALAASTLRRAFRIKASGQPMVAATDIGGGPPRIFSRTVSGWDGYVGGPAFKYADWKPLEWTSRTPDDGLDVNGAFETAYPAYKADRAVTFAEDETVPTQIRSIARGLELLAGVDEDFEVNVVVQGEHRRIVVISVENLYEDRLGTFAVVESASPRELKTRLDSLGWLPSPLGDGYFFTIR